MLENREELLHSAQEALRTREEQLRTITENTPDVLARFDQNLRHVFINGAGASAMGMAPGDIIGRAPHDLGMPRSLSEQLEAVLAKAFESGEQQSIAVSYDGPRGRTHFSTLVVPERDPAGSISTVLAVSRDDTARRNAEDALREADRRKDEFLAVLAHELRNPLAPIRNACEVLARSTDFDQAKNAIDIIRRQTNHLTHLVDDLSDVSRVSQGRIQLRKGPVDLATIVAHAIETVGPQLRDKGHHLSNISSHDPLLVNGDAARLVQCVSNILANAIKYTDRDGEIVVRTYGDETNVFVEVSDNGSGIGPQLLPHIFDLFVQSERTLDRAEGGLGIGLAVVRRLVQMHDGEVSAQSDQHGRGSTFVIRLPRISRMDAPISESVPREANPRRVLVVDDNRDAADSLAMLLAAHHHETRAAYSGIGALADMASFRPQVALIDIGLPDMNGYELVERVRAMPQFASVRLIAVSGYGQAEDQERSRKAGFSEHLVKPVDLLVLERSITGVSVDATDCDSNEKPCVQDVTGRGRASV